MSSSTKGGKTTPTCMEKWTQGQWVHVTLGLHQFQFLQHNDTKGNKKRKTKWKRPIVGKELGPGNLSEAPLSSLQPPCGGWKVETGGWSDFLHFLSQKCWPSPIIFIHFPDHLRIDLSRSGCSDPTPSLQLFVIRLHILLRNWFERKSQPLTPYPPEAKFVYWPWLNQHTSSCVITFQPPTEHQINT